MPSRTDVAVIGGGATGCGVARDLAMRGLDVTLVERGTLNAGTTGRSHGLLHSGARYADVDPESAEACRAESRVLRRIAPGAIDDTGGYFLQLSGDGGAYFERKLGACRDCGIETSVLDGADLRSREPDVTPDVVRAIAVPDAVVYPSRLVAATAASAAAHGARIETGAEVTDIDIGPDRVTVEINGERAGSEPIRAAHLVNAAGAWAGAVARLAGLDVTMAPTRGLMLAVDHDGLGSVLNRCRPPADGDIAVPHPAAVICGTTSVPIDDPGGPGGPGWTQSEVATVRSECAEMLPALAEASIVARYSGARPLYDPGGRSATRGFHVVDHGERDDVAGVTTVVGGKLTTYRRMAEAVSDVVAERLGADGPCRTADEPLPAHDDRERLDELVATYAAGGPADADVVSRLD